MIIYTKKDCYNFNTDLITTSLFVLHFLLLDRSFTDFLFGLWNSIFILCLGRLDG